ncbi:MAG: hypothetical protein AB1428_07305 [Bacteroidota bacterium]
MKIGDLAQDFLDTLQASKSQSGLALFRQKPEVAEEPVVYYLRLNTTLPSKRLTDVYRAEPCPPPEPYRVEHFGGDERVLESYELRVKSDGL